MIDPRLKETANEAAEALARAAERYRPTVRFREVGRVLSVRDGVLRVAGLPGARNEEMLRVGQRATALVLGLERDAVQAAVLDAADTVREGDRVQRTGALASLPVGRALLGRVIDPLGRPLDGEALVGTLRPALLERPAPPIHARAAVHRPLYTGILAIDAMFPVGRGQRELILGDEGTGKTSLALSAMLRQANTEVICVYVAIGRRRAEIWRVVDALRRGGGHWVVVAVPEDASPALRTLAPYAGTTVAEHFRDRGEHALIVYDELTAHAVAWRELSLLLGRPPGREAYPGDVFYLHSRLLERATQLNNELGGGSLTALPIATTEDGRMSAYIPTNLIAITDGQLVLSRPLFAAGERPAIDAGLSVSRVGGKTQAQAFRRLAGKLRLDYAAFLELESFSRVGTRLEASASRRLALGRRLRRLLRAPRLEALTEFEELARLALASRAEALLRIPEDELGEFARTLPEALRALDGGLATRLGEEVVLSEPDEARLFALVDRVVEARWPAEPANA
ncbi:MAG: F0F1 ATP synthase subunit alpha [Alphaproteobacteria bacterium]|nr:F0F1 ATP synthase subunit alpha [Alphaproteobacteria bacterium]MCB9791119.1 F0F1 ATP synthase subunit alpha [Alphaproteobacteria bacterium]